MKKFEITVLAENPKTGLMEMHDRCLLSAGNTKDAAGKYAALFERPEKTGERTTPINAPAWNCVDYPGNGMHYLDKNGGCRWCEMAKDEIARERSGRVPTRKVIRSDDDDHPAPLVGEVVRWIDKDTVLVQWPGEDEPTREAMDELTPYRV